MAAKQHDAETRRLIQSTARETAKAVSANVAAKAVRDTLTSCGIDPSDPIAAQETQSNLRKIAECAPALTEMVSHYRDPETVQAIQFAKSARKVYKSTKARVLAGMFGAMWAGITIWASGIWEMTKKS